MSEDALFAAQLFGRVIRVIGEHPALLEQVHRKLRERSEYSAHWAMRQCLNLMRNAGLDVANFEELFVKHEALLRGVKGRLRPILPDEKWEKVPQN